MLVFFPIIICISAVVTFSKFGEYQRMLIAYINILFDCTSKNRMIVLSNAMEVVNMNIITVNFLVEIDIHFWLPILNMTVLD